MSEKNKNKITVKENSSEHSEKSKKSKQDEFIGVILCFITQFVWTINSICLKYFINRYESIFKNKTYLFPRGLSTILISYILGNINDGKIYSFNSFDSTVTRCILAKANLSFFAMCFWTVAIFYLRVTTCQVISSLCPILVVTFSVFFLKEKFYSKYILGIICGTVGSMIIIIDEHKIQKKDDNPSLSGYFLGVISIIMNVVLQSFNNITNKYMAKRVSIYTQMFYLGIFHSVYSFLWMLFTWDFDYTVEYFFASSLQAILFFLGNFFYNLTLTKISMSKYSYLQYSKFVMAFIMGWGILKEEVLMNDMIGTTLIGGYLIYNILMPNK